MSEIETIDVIKMLFEKWLKPLGLLWWKIEILYITDPKTIIERFKSSSDDGIVVAKTNANWTYGTGTIWINVPALSDLSSSDIEHVVVHELCHILVNEMREEDMHHEERVVTQLTKAFIWTMETGIERIG